MKRVAIISDLHCGHRVGLTPPDFQVSLGISPEEDKWALIRSSIWGWYDSLVSRLNPIDILIVNGDAIEGAGSKSGGTELIIRDRNMQCDMAYKAIKKIGAKEVRMLRGSNNHTGSEEDWEDQIAKRIGCPIGDHEWFNINGLVFDCKHYVPSSGMPQTKNSGVLADALWNLVWSAHDGAQPKSNIFIRSHLHFYTDAVGIVPNQRVFITPALQGAGSKFGARYCRRVVQVGLLVFEIENEREWIWKAHLMNLQSQAASVETL
jgi:hypothetical protein